MAGLPGNNSCVKVGPPLSCNGPRMGSVLIWSPVAVKNPPPLSLARLYPREVIAPLLLKRVPPAAPAFSTVSSICVVPPVQLKMAPPPLPRLPLAELPLKVQSFTVSELLKFTMPPPTFGPEFPLMVVLVTVDDPLDSVKIPPPSPPAELLLMEQFVTVSGPVL